jgi:benzoyl-CoA reductase subunit C
MSTLEKLETLSENLVNPAIEKWKAEGKKVVGFFCSYVPEEILYAADILPVRVRAPGCKDTTSADVYFSQHNCSFMRSCLEYALEGKYDFLDGLVFTNSCDHVRRVYDTLREIRADRFPFLEFISVPHKTSEQSISFYRDELIEFQKKAAAFSGVNITEVRLKEAIDIYNETRRLLKEVYALRHGSSPPITGAQSLSVILAGQSIPKDQYNVLLQSLLTEMGEAQGLSGYRARLMIAGSGGCDDPAYFQIFEDLGGLIVTDSLCSGSRYFWKPVKTNGDLTGSLAVSYMNRPSCASMGDRVVERIDYVKNMVKEFNVDGVIYERMRYCDLWGGQILLLRKELKTANIPLLELEKDYMIGATGQLKTRAQAFLEKIGR